MTKAEFERRHAWKRDWRRANPLTDAEREQIRRDNERANDPNLTNSPYLRAALNLKPAQPQTKTQSLNEMIDSGEIGY